MGCPETELALRISKNPVGRLISYTPSFSLFSPWKSHPGRFTSSFDVVLDNLERGWMTIHVTVYDILCVFECMDNTRLNRLPIRVSVFSIRALTLSNATDLCQNPSQPKHHNTRLSAAVYSLFCLFFIYFLSSPSSIFISVIGHHLWCFHAISAPCPQGEVAVYCCKTSQF